MLDTDQDARLRSLLDAAQAGVSSLALREVLRRVLAAVRDLFRADAAAVWRLDESGVPRRYGSVGLSEQYVRAATAGGPGDGIADLVLRGSQPLAIEDIGADARLAHGQALLNEGLRSALSAPLFSRGRPIGALTVYRRRPFRFDEAELELLAGLANVVAASIDNALLHARTERALSGASAQQELLRTIVESAQDGILALDAEGRVVLFSPGCERLTGLSASEAEGRLASEVLRDVHGDGLPCPPECPVRPIGRLRGDQPAYSELRLESPDGSGRWVGATLARVPGRRPGRVRSVMVLRDITSAKEMDELKSNLLATISHELRTPLTSIRALSELLAEHDLGDPAEAREMAATINRESERLGRLVENVLDATRIEAGRLPTHPRPVDLEPVVHEAIAALAGQAPLRFDLALPASLPRVMADPDRLRQVLDNLLSNAAKYAAAGGSARISGECDGPTVRLSVADRGPGIPATELPHLFERFHRVDANGSARGAGLGLFISNSLVELMGGRLEVTSRLGEGSCFSLFLPRAEEGLA
jgi:PAS domain S-box-containing protein